ncbi:MAG: adenosylcobinamide-phosphate synthase CbiB [Muribaculum sp.]|nr:adenosylcobinamide-phosphate synthase CbiB [Muribaculum sp.]
MGIPMRGIRAGEPADDGGGSAMSGFVISRSMILCHMIAFGAGFLLDLALGDPHWLPHPVRLIGKLIAAAEKRLYRPGGAAEQFGRGAALACIVTIAAAVWAGALLFAAYGLHPCAGIAAECVMTYQMLAVKCLRTESMNVWRHLKDGDLQGARRALSMIVGRDTACLDEEGVAKAAVETVAENTSDGVAAPMLYLAVGGPVLGFFYKAVNTLDSTVGYRNERYLYFGRAAARLDDFMNWIPARISAVLMIAASFLAGDGFSGRGAWRIYRRDRRNHASPNSAQTESVCAGALGIRLGGDARYFGKTVRKPYIGDALRRAEYEDIRRANRLLYAAAWMCQAVCLLGLAGLAAGWNGGM